MSNLQNNIKLVNSIPPNSVYIPVNNMQDFNFDVYSYYNQYYASPYVTQQRRILRNYLNNQQSIKEANQNPFLNNNGKKFNFLYTYDQNYMIVTQKNTINVFIRINNSWCRFKQLPNNNYGCAILANIIKQSKSQ